MNTPSTKTEYINLEPDSVREVLFDIQAIAIAVKRQLCEQPHDFCRLQLLNMINDKIEDLAIRIELAGRELAT
jgi:hypothetical protein